MRLVAAARQLAFDVSVMPIDLADVLLESWAIFAEVVPQPGEVSPLLGLERFRRYLCRGSHGQEVISQPVRFAARADVRQELWP